MRRRFPCFEDLRKQWFTPRRLLLELGKRGMFLTPEDRDAEFAKVTACARCGRGRESQGGPDGLRVAPATPCLRGCVLLPLRSASTAAACRVFFTAGWCTALIPPASQQLFPARALGSAYHFWSVPGPSLFSTRFLGGSRRSPSRSRDLVGRVFSSWRRSSSSRPAQCLCSRRIYSHSRQWLCSQRCFASLADGHSAIARSACVAVSATGRDVFRRLYGPYEAPGPVTSLSSIRTRKLDDPSLRSRSYFDACIGPTSSRCLYTHAARS